MATDHNHTATPARLVITVILNLVITAAEVVGGLLSGSLSLLSDALHNLSDALAVLLSYVAMRLARRGNTARHTFGLKRAEILAALINAAVLLVLSVYLLYRAAVRFAYPEAVQGRLMMIVASVGLAANVAATLLLRRGARDSMNIRSAYLHLLSDAISSIAVVAGALVISLFGIAWIDPLLTILISLYVLKQSYSLVRDAVHVLLEGAPADLDLARLKHQVERLPRVHGIHHVHVWTVGEHDIHFEAHVQVEDMALSETVAVRMKIEELLREEFRINHAALQLECDNCGEVDLIRKGGTVSGDRS